MTATVTILDLSVIEVAAALAGAALGLSLVGAALVALTGTATHHHERARASLWVDLTAALERLHQDREDEDARELVFSALEPGKRTEDGLQVVASIVGLHREHDELVAALGDGRIDDRLTIAIASGTRDAVRHALELAGHLRRRETLPVVLMRAQDDDPEIRRIAVTSLARIAPATALTHLMSRLSSLGPWAVELLAALLADGTHESWVAASALEDDRPRSLVDLVNVLAVEAENPNGQRRRAAIDALGSIDHRLARVALGRVHSDAVVEATSGAVEPADELGDRRRERTPLLPDADADGAHAELDAGDATVVVLDA